MYRAEKKKKTTGGQEYEVLVPPALFRAGSGDSLWLNDTHLLYIRQHLYTESYRRFYFRDITALSLRETGRHVLYALIFLLCATICAVLAGVLYALDSSFYLVWGVVFVLFLIALIFNWLAGPTCVFHVSTGLDTWELRRLRRLRAARGILERLAERVEQVQGRLSESARNTLLEGGEFVTGSRTGFTGEVADLSVNTYRGACHLALFSLLLLGALWSGGLLLIPSFFLFMAQVLTLSAAAVCSLLAVILYRQNRVPGTLYRSSVLAAIFATGAGCVALGILIYSAPDVLFGNMAGGTAPAMADAFQGVADTFFFSVYTMIVLVVAGVVGLSGFSMTLAYRRGRAAAVPPPPIRDHNPESPS